ncbi:hypothetical protein H2O64_18125 [Kordia sp. YSTF-M3]|uniref:Uncharacterized protein n=1 Tax=Kordia aestuariivivens TaxID=2759037 RepID=A0ABR7QDF0_9FLAO|nr:hypothetical protein [Kordia aestuariivivens]MBC8756595.1 hypothetical protein [Kordia aestuariivivens]
MKKKSKILKLKKFTIASFRAQYHIIGAGQTNNAECSITLDLALCKTDEPDTSCISSLTDPLSNQRRGCASHVGSTD